MAEHVLVIGSGGREHALAWKLAQSPHVQKVLVAPGNAGTADCGKICNSAVSVSNHSILAQFCKDHNVGLVVVGPEVPLAAGKKAFFLTSQDKIIDLHKPAMAYKTISKTSKTDITLLCRADFPALVVKASGLAAGKGVIVAKDKDEACQAVLDIMKDKTFGTAGDTVVVEELLEGEEVSVSVSEEMLQQIRTTVLQKTVDGMKEDGIPYVGVLYAGLMLTDQGPKVLEFNCRFGDPECQVSVYTHHSFIMQLCRS
uniref:phosphoribosylamine--glycine ligase n=1 Tax=Astyanax mexicanus TaxID=7994 RepID=A0A8B9GV14_ASTMX